MSRWSSATEVWPVEIDAGEMELAVLNLCLNARDAMAGGGTITIAAENVARAQDDGGSQQTSSSYP